MTIAPAGRSGSPAATISARRRMWAPAPAPSSKGDHFDAAVGELHRHHTIGAGRHRGAGHDAHGGLRRAASAGGVAGRDGAGNRQAKARHVAAERRSRPSPRRRLAARRPRREVGSVSTRPQRQAPRQSFRRQRRQKRFQALPGVFGWDHLRMVKRSGRLGVRLGVHLLGGAILRRAGRPAKSDQALTKHFQYRGNLAETTLPEMLYTIDRFRVPGVIWASHGKDERVVKRVFIRDGYVVHASSTDRNDSLGVHLRRTGRITLEQFERVTRAREETTKRFGTLLVEERLLSPQRSSPPSASRSRASSGAFSTGTRARSPTAPATSSRRTWCRSSCRCARSSSKESSGRPMPGRCWPGWAGATPCWSRATGPRS